MFLKLQLLMVSKLFTELKIINCSQSSEFSELTSSSPGRLFYISKMGAKIAIFVYKNGHKSAKNCHKSSKNVPIHLIFWVNQ